MDEWIERWIDEFVSRWVTDGWICLLMRGLVGEHKDGQTGG